MKTCRANAPSSLGPNSDLVCNNDRDKQHLNEPPSVSSSHFLFSPRELLSSPLALSSGDERRKRCPVHHLSSAAGMVASSSPSGGGSSSRDNDGMAAAAKAISGMGAGVLSTMLCSPLDVAKTRVQVQTVGGGDVRYRGVLGALSTILREEGLAGWFRGIAPAVSSVAVFWAVYFPCYDAAKEKVVDVTGLDGVLEVPLLGAARAATAPEAHPPAQGALWAHPRAARMQTRGCGGGALAACPQSPISLPLTTQAYRRPLPSSTAALRR